MNCNSEQADKGMKYLEGTYLYYMVIIAQLSFKVQASNFQNIQLLKPSSTAHKTTVLFVRIE